MNDVMKLVKDMAIAVTAQDFGLECVLDLRVRLDSVDDFLERAGKIEGSSVEETTD